MTDEPRRAESGGVRSQSWTMLLQDGGHLIIARLTPLSEYPTTLSLHFEARILHLTVPTFHSAPTTSTLSNSLVQPSPRLLGNPEAPTRDGCSSSCQDRRSYSHSRPHPRTTHKTPLARSSPCEHGTRPRLTGIPGTESPTPRCTRTLAPRRPTRN